MARLRPASHRRAAVGVALAAALWLVGTAAARLATAAQSSSHCDPALPVSTANPLGYRLRGDRCEGVFIQEVSAAGLTVVSLTRMNGDVRREADALHLTWAPTPQEVHLRAYALRPRTYYRMDTRRPAGATSYRWPTDVLAALRLAPEDVGVVATSRAMVGGRARDVYLPVQIGGPAGSVPYDLQLIPGVELRELFVGTSRVGSDGRPAPTAPRPLEYGYYPAGRAVRVPIGPFPEPGTYFVEVGATVRGGGAVSADLWILHSTDAAGR